MTEAEKIAAFFDDEWEYMLKENPLDATLLGDLRYNSRLPDFSLDAIHRRQQHDREALSRLQGISRPDLSAADQLNFDLFHHDLTERIEGQQFPEPLLMMNQMSGIHLTLPSLVPELPFRTTKHYEDYFQRLRALPEAIDQTIGTLQEGLKQNITPPKITVRDVAKQIQAQFEIQVNESAFFEPVQQSSNIFAEREKESLCKEVTAIIENSVFPAYRQLHSFWSDEYYPQTRDTIALSALPDGEAWYSYVAKVSTTTNLNPHEIHEIGLQEVRRIRGEMDKIIQQTGGKSFDEFIEFLRTDPQFFYNTSEQLLAAYRDVCKRADAVLPSFFGKLPRLTYGVREVPSYAAPSMPTAYYSRGSLQAGRPGWFYANTFKLQTRPKWEMEALSLHEAVPGHHLQIALAQEIEDVPAFRNYTNYTAFIEGWGLYSESLGAEMGFYQDPYSRFGQYTYEIWRAIRLVLDTGIHLLNWDRQKAIDYFKENSGKQEHDIVVEVDRYIVWPGQALAYKIGELKMKELREYAAQKLGALFDLREFHDRMLAEGALPLSMLETNIRTYVQQHHKTM
jgi:uncharacterized protein (DUF885 family)